MTKKTPIYNLHFRVRHRTHITQHKMYKMGFSKSDICSQCWVDTYLHALWLCSQVHHFWWTVTQNFSSVLDCRIPLSPNLCLLGDLTVTDLPNNQSQSTFAALAIAKKTILIHWKNKQALSIIHWLNLLREHILTNPNHICYQKKSIDTLHRSVKRS